MRWFISPAVLILLLLVRLTPAGGNSEGARSLEIMEAAICRQVSALQCLHPGVVFMRDVRQLFCFTKVRSEEESTVIFHVWYYMDAEMGRVELPIRSPNWRTYSSKVIGSDQTGPWRVEIFGPSGERLETLDFEIVS
jgi:hypothetical protein